MDRLRTFSLAAAMILTLTCASAHAQQPTTLDTYRQKAFDEGLNAAQRQDWFRAYQGFRSALNEPFGPAHGPVFFNLGLVFKAIGAPVQAAACFQAYLALTPKPTNAAAVRQEIAALIKMRRTQIDAIAQRVLDMLRKEANVISTGAYQSLAGNIAIAGDIGKAVGIIKLMSDDALARVPDLHLPDPWYLYAAALGPTDIYWHASFNHHRFEEFGYPMEAKQLFDSLARIFPIPAPLNNPNDSVAGTIDSAFKKRAEKIADLRKQVDARIAAPAEAAPAGDLSPAARRQTAFANRLRLVTTFDEKVTDRYGRKAEIFDRPKFDLESAVANVRDYQPHPDAPGFGQPRASADVARSLADLVGEFGMELFRFELVQRGSDAGAYAVMRPEIDEALWSSVNDINRPEALHGYLAWFPTGKYAELASLKAKTMAAEAKLAPAPSAVSVEEALRRGREAQKVSNYPEQLKWFRLAADQGNAEAQFELAEMYGGNSGVAQDDAEAFRWVQKAANQGNPRAMHSIAFLFANGRSVAKDSAEAFRWAHKAAEQGWGVADLGRLYEASNNYSEAMKWYLKAADSGDHAARYELGRLYQNGLGVAKDNKKAVYWYRQVAEKGAFIWVDLAKSRLKELGVSSP